MKASGRIWMAVALAAWTLGAGLVGAAESGGQRLFGLGYGLEVEALPAGRLKRELTALPAPARERALAWLRGVSFPAEDVADLHVDAAGGIHYACAFQMTPGTAPERAELAAVATPVGVASLPISPFPESLRFSSLPGSAKTLYLDFTGGQVSGTAWNDSVGRSLIDARPFSLDGDDATFNEAEQLVIRRVWQRVVEDFAPFDINVTTVEPTVMTLLTAHVMITRSKDANGLDNPTANAGGVAYLNVFGFSDYAVYRPAWVYHNNLQNQEDYIAEAVSHEAGHNFGLSHDGRLGLEEYYYGHGSGAISWGPLMGVGRDRQVTQWSKGEYTNANNPEDDLAIIATKVSYRPDDHGDSLEAPSRLMVTNGTEVVATTLETDPSNAWPANKGMVGRMGDVDFWTLVSGAGTLDLTVRPWVSAANRRGGNLDVKATLYDARGTMLLQSDPATETVAGVKAVVAGGVYYLAIERVGAGDPMAANPTGYTEYGSLGQYVVTGRVADATGLAFAPVARLLATPAPVAGATSLVFQVTYVDDTGVVGSSIGSDDVQVTGLRGEVTPVLNTAGKGFNNGTPKTATYLMAAPGGTWGPEDNGLYTISVNSNAVRDVSGLYAEAGPIGTFAAALPSPLFVAAMDVDPGWVRDPGWDHGVPSGTGGMPAAGATGTQVLGFNLAGNYGSSQPPAYVVTPAVDCSGTDRVILRFQRWLGIRAGDTAVIEVAVGAAAWVPVWSSSGTLVENSWQSMEYDLSAVAARQAAVRLRWGLASNGDGQVSFGWNLDDVEVLGVMEHVDTVPPVVVSLAADAVTAAGAGAYDFSVTYSDDSGIAVASLDDQDLWVTGPAGYGQGASLLTVDVLTDGSPRRAVYRIVPPGGVWDEADNGDYVITLRQAAVWDLAGNAMAGGALGGFTVAIAEAPPVPGALRMVLGPEWARQQGAAWRCVAADPPVWLVSGAVAEGLAPGVHAITFRAVEGWEAPADRAVAVVSGETNSAEAVYVAMLTTQHPTPLWWLMDQGVTQAFEEAAVRVGSNGMAYWESYLAGLDPSDAASVFEIEALADGGPGAGAGSGDRELVMRWSSVSGRTYAVYGLPAAGATGLVAVAGGEALPWPVNSFTNRVEQGAPRFYRLGVRLTDP